MVDVSATDYIKVHSVDSYQVAWKVDEVLHTQIRQQRPVTRHDCTAVLLYLRRSDYSRSMKIGDG
jgi:hypothetical protein